MDRGIEGSVLTAGLLEAEVEVEIGVGAEAGVGTTAFRFLCFPVKLLRLPYSDILDGCKPVSGGEQAAVVVAVVVAVTAVGLAVDEFVAAGYAVEVVEDLPVASQCAMAAAVADGAAEDNVAGIAVAGNVVVGLALESEQVFHIPSWGYCSLVVAAGDKHCSVHPKALFGWNMDYPVVHSS